jgi:hypothetical protein
MLTVSVLICGVGEDQRADAVSGACLAEGGELGVVEGATVEAGLGALTAWDRVGEFGRAAVGVGGELDDDCVVVAVVLDISAQTLRGGCLDDVLRCASQALVQVSVVGIDDGAPPSEVGEDSDGRVGGLELPWLGVVARGCERSEADEFLHVRTGAP